MTSVVGVEGLKASERSELVGNIGKSEGDLCRPPLFVEETFEKDLSVSHRCFR